MCIQHFRLSECKRVFLHFKVSRICDTGESNKFNNNPFQTSVTDVLHAMGAVPAGFRDSTLAKKAASGIGNT